MQDDKLAVETILERLCGFKSVIALLQKTRTTFADSPYFFGYFLMIYNKLQNKLETRAPFVT